MQDRAEDFAFQIVGGRDLGDGRGEQMALVGAGGQFGAGNDLRVAFEPLQVGVERGLRVGVDNRADVGGGVGRIAHDLGGEGALEALDQGVGGVMRDIEQTQGRAALT